MPIKVYRESRERGIVDPLGKPKCGRKTNLARGARASQMNKLVHDERSGGANRQRDRSRALNSSNRGVNGPAGAAGPAVSILPIPKMPSSEGIGSTPPA